MGTLNGSGEQKGVDSMIVIDLIELARNHAITDAVLVSGDEDVRVGVQFAQSYGVRVHLIGIASESGKSNQSPSLLQEADTHVNWSQDVIQSFLSIRQPKTGRDAPTSQTVEQTPPSEAPRPEVSQPATLFTETATENHSEQREESAPAEVEPSAEETNAKLATVAVKLAEELIVGDLTKLKEAFQTSNSLPPEFDGKLLWRGKTALGRALQPQEKGALRKAFRDAVKAQ